MQTENLDLVYYYLSVQSGFLELNQLLDHKLTIIATGTQCLNCKAAKPIFRQGFCQSCFFESPAVGDWIMRPELSKAHLGQADRDLAYETKMQLQPHIVYLALSSHLKVGVTRKSQLPTRWIDQGAHQAIPLVEVPNRYLAGVGEVALKQYFSDKTNWRKMLQKEAEPVDWESARNQALAHLPKELEPFIVRNSDLYKIHFPVLQHPNKVTSLNLKKTPNYSGKLKGIKGQYLIFEDATVFNIRSNEGQCVTLSVG